MTSSPIRSAAVAGRGTRLLPATRAQPEEMLAVLDKPVIQYVVEGVRLTGEEHRHDIGEVEGYARAFLCLRSRRPPPGRIAARLRS